jgi:LysR family transcriptional regulator, pca operon transcriptional activator
MIDGRIKFRHLQCFLAVAQNASLQKAAVALSITQPAVSKTIKELESLLNIRLFDRGSRGTQMTLQAEIFSAYAEAAVTALQQAKDFMGPAKHAANPLIRIGATPAITVSFVPQALMTLHQRIPDIQVSILTGTTNYLMSNLKEGEFDLVLCRHLDPEQMLGLSFEYLFSDPLITVVRPGHPLLTSSVAGIDPQRNFIAVLPPNTSINRRATTPLAMALNLHPLVNFIESRSISFGRTFTLQSDAIWFVPWCAVKADLDQHRLVRLIPPSKGEEEAIGLMARSTGLMMQSNFVPSPQMQVLISAMRDCALAHRQELA